MAKNLIKGNDLMLFDEQGKSYGLATNHTLTVNTETSEISCKDTGMYGAVEVTKYTWEINTENFIVMTDFGKLYDTYLSGSPITLKFGLKAEKDAYKTVWDGDYDNWSLDTTKDYWEGTAIITNLTVNAQNGEVSSYTATFSGMGKLEHKKGA